MNHRIQAIASIIALGAAIVFGARSVLLLGVTLATNDPRDYQPLVRSSLESTAVAAVLTLAFVLLARNNWRFLGCLPALLCALSWYEAARNWPAVFPQHSHAVPRLGISCLPSSSLVVWPGYASGAPAQVTPNWSFNRSANGMAPWPCDRLGSSSAARPGRHTVVARLTLR